MDYDYRLPTIDYDYGPWTIDQASPLENIPYEIVILRKFRKIVVASAFNTDERDLSWIDLL